MGFLLELKQAIGLRSGFGGRNLTVGYYSGGWGLLCFAKNTMVVGWVSNLGFPIFVAGSSRVAQRLNEVELKMNQSKVCQAFTKILSQNFQFKAREITAMGSPLCRCRSLACTFSTDQNHTSKHALNKETQTNLKTLVL